MYKAKYYVLCSGSIGGAEKRFADIFIAQVKAHMPVYFIAPSVLCNLIFSHDEIINLGDRLIQIKMSRWSSWRFLMKYGLWLIRNGSSNFIFHYPLNPLIMFHYFMKNNYAISLCDCVRDPGKPLRGKLGFMEWVSIQNAKGVDVLSPTILRNLNKRFPKREFTLTPGGTFINVDRINPTLSRTFQKKNKLEVIFLSRLEPLKGSSLFLDMIRDYFKLNCSKENISFRIYGLGSLENVIRRKVFELNENLVDIKYCGYSPSGEALKTADIVCSFQEVTNYPSRVIPEALLSGCNVLVTDTGDSKEFGLLNGLHYVTPTPEATASALLDLMNQIFSFEISRNEISSDALLKFTSTDYIRYMFNIGFDNDKYP